MITFPPNLVAVRYPGYYWDVVDQKLYSIKQYGELREIKLRPDSKWNNFQAGYVVSHKGIRQYLLLRILKKLQPKDSVVPMMKQ
jgi:hypothetical protein